MEKCLFLNNIQCTIENVHCISLHMKSAKAIRRKRSCIEEKLMQLGQDKVISSNVKCNKLFDMVRAIHDLSGAYCTRCNKSLGKTEIKRCNGCNRMSYCSKACQREDWLSGHNLTCSNKHYTVEQPVIFLVSEVLFRNPFRFVKIKADLNLSVRTTRAHENWGHTGDPEPRFH